MKKTQTIKLALSAIFIALAAGLSQIKVLQMPLGGSITLFSMLPIVMIAYALGINWGLASAFVYSLTQLFFGILFDGVLGWGLTPLSLVGTIFLDYIIPFTALGLVGLASKKGNIALISGTVAVLVIRFLCHLLSGAIIFDIWCEWENVWLYSLCYNGAYMLPELAITVIGAAILFNIPQIKRLLIKITNDD